MHKHTAPKALLLLATASSATRACQRLEAASLTVACKKTLSELTLHKRQKKERVMRKLMTRFYPMGSRLATRAKGDALKCSMRVWRPRVYCSALPLGKSR